jgi:hypothetical protein
MGEGQNSEIFCYYNKSYKKDLRNMAIATMLDAISQENAFI